MTTTTVCAIEGCGKPSRKRGFCPMHYQHWRRERASPCSVPSCGKPAQARGLCSAHYEHWRMSQPDRPMCSVDGCSKPVYADGKCATHHVRHRRKAEQRTCSVPGCSNPFICKGLCHKHYTRKRTHGDTEHEREPPASHQFLAAAVFYEGDDCLLWPWPISGTNAVIGINSRQTNPCRVLCEMVYGPPPSPKHHAAHSCGRGHLGCCTPKHLRWATPTENQADRLLHGTDLRGSKCSWAKLTEDDVRDIRVRIALGEMHKDIAALYNVSIGTITSINLGQNWAWLK